MKVIEILDGIAHIESYHGIDERIVTYKIRLEEIIAYELKDRSCSDRFVVTIICRQGAKIDIFVGDDILCNKKKIIGFLDSFLTQR